MSMAQVFQFLFILVLPLLLVAGAVVTLFAVGALFDALDHPEELNERLVAAFSGRGRPGRTVGPEHYYQRYWRG